ncbi:SDR family oxidoreductase [Pendulispora rubella]|uniref:SDR family oxidoreductase n=1 Tax=Pendulispora rubella TaxID=2741070 RepID=A0ABZ2KQ03_9BACT
MKIVVIGGTGLIGSKLVRNLTAAGHEALAASPNTGVNTVTGVGVREALAGASVLVDVSNSPSFEDAAVLDFFSKATRNLVSAAAATGIKHYVALSVVGSERMPDSGYLRAKVAQELLIKASSIPYTIVRATQFFEFVKAIADSATVDGKVRLPKALIQPLSSDNVAYALTEATLDKPANGIIEIAGPETFPMVELIRQGLSASKDPRPVISDDDARYYGALLSERSLLPGGAAHLGTTRYADWLRQSTL